jgi:hypothetical protein
VNTPLLTNFAARSAHDMAAVGKDVAKRFYGTAVNYSYWNGCSTGGRQGYEEAQDYPADFDGILATSAAVDWNTAEIGNLWSQAVFNEERVAPTRPAGTGRTRAPTSPRWRPRACRSSWRTAGRSTSSSAIPSSTPRSSTTARSTSC